MCRSVPRGGGGWEGAGRAQPLPRAAKPGAGGGTTHRSTPGCKENPPSQCPEPLSLRLPPARGLAAMLPLSPARVRSCSSLPALSLLCPGAVRVLLPPPAAAFPDPLYPQDAVSLPCRGTSSPRCRCWVRGARGAHSPLPRAQRRAAFICASFRAEVAPSDTSLVASSPEGSEGALHVVDVQGRCGDQAEPGLRGFSSRSSPAASKAPGFGWGLCWCHRLAAKPLG